ncbi:MAG TPA: hypothetical protein VE398_04055 [Acidobacteriota bacterium]|nr:hypothetical protein [Acidobacteriota bacterium]
MKIRFLACLSLVLPILRAEAATYTVKQAGGGNFANIQACANALAAGDTCVVYAGTYNEVVTIPAGTAGNYRTLTVNTGDAVYVYGFVINSYTKVIGFNIQRPSSPNSNACVSVSANAIYWYITNNTMYACDGIREAFYTTGTGHGFIQGNTISYPCSTSTSPNVCSGMSINGDHHLIENNDISHVSDGVSHFGSYNVYRNNTFHDCTESDCGSNSSNCHIDFIESEPVTSGGVSKPSQYNLFEGNLGRNSMGGNNHGFLTQADACGGQCYDVIIRFNDLAHFGTFALLDDNTGFPYVKCYNNNFIDFNSSGQMATNGHQVNATHGAEVNNLFYYPTSVRNYSPYYVDSSSNSGFTAGSNLAWCTATCAFLNRTNASSFINDAPGNKISDPIFVDYAQDNFKLSAGSPAIRAGTFLATVATGDSGTGTSLVVNDASFFQDGYGITGVQADWIRVGASTTVQISSINYPTNTITLANSISRSPGDPIYLYKDSSGRVVLFGNAPDIGAYPYGLDAPKSLRIVTQ